MRKKYVVSIEWLGDSLCCLETYSIYQACKFLETINFTGNDVVVRFFIEDPFYEFDVKSVLEVLHGKIFF